MDGRDDGLQDIVISKLRMVEDLRTKLVHVKWGQDSFVLLLRIIQDTRQELLDRSSHEQLSTLLLEIEEHLSRCLQDGKLPQGKDRNHLMVLLDSLQNLWLRQEDRQRQGRSRTALPAGEVLLMAPGVAAQLEHKLHSSGFQVTTLNKLEELQLQLLKTSPQAVIIDLDSDGEPADSFTLIQRIRNRIGLMPPVFFIAERGDLAARLDAVLAGGSGYFTKPLNLPLLLDRLNERLLLGDGRGFRVIILNDKPSEAGGIARALETRGITTQVITQPRRIIQAIHRFQPNLLIVDLDMDGEVKGTDLAKVIRQHEACVGLSLVLLTEAGSLSQHLRGLGPESGDILLKPLHGEHLAAAITYRLRHGDTLHQKLSTLNQKDTATGLYNRRFFLDQLEFRMADARPEGLAVMLVSLDNLRALEASDVIAAEEVVEWAARRLQRALAADLRASRFGDATFAVLVASADGEKLLNIAREIRAVLETEVYDAGKDTVQLYTSIGISVAHTGQQDVPTLIQQADLACNVARRGGGETIHIYHPQADRQLEESHEQRLLAEVQEAVEQQRMSLVYQPVVNLRGDRTERYEVLLRMRNQEGRELLPETVFGLARRQRRLGMVLDRWVVAHAIRELRERRGRNHQPVLFINVSPTIFQDSEFADWLREGFQKTGVRPECLVFEISEATARRHLAQYHRFLERVRLLGCGLSLDRFGGQEESLALLEKLPIDYVKLDPAFASGLVNDTAKQDRLRILATSLADHSIITIMGSIEDLPTLYALWSCGITYVQGYFLQRPQGEMSYDFEGKVH